MSLTSEFLAHKRIAVAGVSRDPSRHGANAIYRRLRSRGYEVFAVNPNTDTVEGDRSYPDLGSIPGGVDGVVIATAPAHAGSIARQAHDLGITRVWMHRGPVRGSVSASAVDYCRANGMSVIAGGCPLMFGPASDVGHRLMCWWLQRTGAVPQGI